MRVGRWQLSERSSVEHHTETLVSHSEDCIYMFLSCIMKREYAAFEIEGHCSLVDEQLGWEKEGWKSQLSY